MSPRFPFMPHFQLVTVSNFITCLLSFRRCLQMNLRFMVYKNSLHMSLRWIFFFSSCNEQSAVSLTYWGTRHHLYPGQTSHTGFCCQKYHPFNRDKSGRGQPAYCHKASDYTAELSEQTGGRVNKAHLFLMIICYECFWTCLKKKKILVHLLWKYHFCKIMQNQDEWKSGHELSLVELKKKIHKKCLL